MARIMIVLFVVLFVGVGSAQGQIVNVGDSDSVRLARVRVLMDQEPAGSGSLLFGSGSLLNGSGSVLTLEPQRFAVAQSGSGSSGGGWWTSGATWFGFATLAAGGLGLYMNWQEYQQDPNNRPSDVEETIYYTLIVMGGLSLIPW